MEGRAFRRSGSGHDRSLSPSSIGDRGGYSYGEEKRLLGVNAKAVKDFSTTNEQFQPLEREVARSQEDHQGSKIVKGLSEYSGFLNEEEMESIESALKRAKQGLKKFQESYEKGSPEWKEILISGDEGKAIQAVYLGLKCLTNTTTSKRSKEEIDRFVSLFQKYAGEGLSIIVPKDEKYNIRLPAICNESSVKKLLTDPKYSDLFNDYIPGSSAWKYLSDLDKSFEEARVDKTTWRWTKQELAKFQTKQGVFFGFPPDAIDGFVKYDPSVDKIYDGRSLSEDEWYLIRGSRDKKFRDKDDNQSKIRKLLREKFPDIEEDAAEYIVSRAIEKLFGAEYTADIRSERDKYYCDKLNFIFNKSGMTEYLASLNPPTS